MSNYSGQDQDNNFTESLTDAHARIALEQSAMMSARLAIARWSNGSLGAHAPVFAFDPESARGRWYDQVQNQFQNWLERGGFADSADLGAASNANNLTLPDSGSHADACID